MLMTPNPKLAKPSGRRVVLFTLLLVLAAMVAMVAYVVADLDLL